MSLHDLLRLTRTTKILRSLLLQKSTRSIWKAALANIRGLPGIPDDLNEPAYASLLYDRFCHVCLLLI
jgi:hypothetical protein